ncbi:MAG: hypothetical protein AAF539_01990 [Planctomycetota bacterium]
MAFAVWLQRTETIGWPQESFDDDDADYRRRRRRARLRVNVLFFICGLLILVATLAGNARAAIWAGCWLSVMAVLMVILLLACLDVWRTYRHQIQRLNDLRRKRS